MTGYRQYFLTVVCADETIDIVVKKKNTWKKRYTYNTCITLLIYDCVLFIILVWCVGGGVGGCL